MGKPGRRYSVTILAASVVLHCARNGIERAYRRLLPRSLFLAEPEPGQSRIEQSIGVALAILDGIDDALGDYFVNNIRLPSIVKFLAGAIECDTHQSGGFAIKDGASPADKRQNRCHGIVVR
jgi:hypothetical protein